MSFRVKDRKWKQKRKYVLCEARMLYDCWHEENQRHQRFKDKLQPRLRWEHEPTFIGEKQDRGLSRSRVTQLDCSLTSPDSLWQQGTGWRYYYSTPTDFQRSTALVLVSVSGRRLLSRPFFCDVEHTHTYTHWGCEGQAAPLSIHAGFGRCWCWHLQ